MKSILFFSRTGCFLPLLIVLNLLFGWIFLRPLFWLATETVLVLLFAINGFFITRKIISASRKRPGKVIDVEGEVVEERHQLK